MFLRFMTIVLLCGTLALGVFSYAMGRPDGLMAAVLGVTALTITCRGLFSEQARRLRARSLTGAADHAKGVDQAKAAAAKRSKAAPVLKAPVKPVVRKRHVSRHAPPRRSAARRAAARS